MSPEQKNILEHIRIHGRNEMAIPTATKLNCFHYASGTFYFLLIIPPLDLYLRFTTVRSMKYDGRCPVYYTGGKNVPSLCPLKLADLHKVSGHTGNRRLTKKSPKNCAPVNA